MKDTRETIRVGEWGPIISVNPFLLGQPGAEASGANPFTSAALFLSQQPQSQPPIPAELGTPHAWLLGDGC